MNRRLPALLAALSLGAAMNASAATRIERHPYGRTPGGEPVELFTLAREGAPTVSITSYGGYVVSGDALRAQGLPNEAVDAWYQGFETTGSPIFLTFLEEHFLAQEQPLAAIEALKRCVARARKDTLPRFYLGKLFFRLEMLDDALAVLQSLDGRASYAPTLHYLLGRIHERRRN